MMMYSMTPFDNFDRHFFSDMNTPKFDSFRTDIREEGDHYVLDADLPGFDREDIHLELQGDVLTITAQHNNEKEDKDEEGKYLCRERSTSSFTRSFDVSGIDTEKITAAYDKGVLTLTLPKQTEEVPASRRIEHFGKVAAWWIHRLPWHAHRSGNVRLTLSEAGDGFRPLFHISI